MNILGNRIKKERENLNLSREDLAKKIGVSYSAIAMYERGEREPNNDLTRKMCETFNCSMDYLMGITSHKNPKSELEKELLQFHLTLNEYNQIKKLLTSNNYNVVKLLEEKNISEKNKKILHILYDYVIDYDFTQMVTKLNGVRTDCSVQFPNDIDDITLDKKLNEIDEISSVKFKNLLNELDERNFIYATDLNNESQYFMCPVYGQISAGQPNWAEECIEGRLPIDTNLMNILNPEEYFFLRVNGESMNKVIKNGAFALIHKQEIVDDGEIAVVLVNGYDATLKKFTRQGDFIILEPESNDSSIKSQVYDKTTNIKILGKYVGKMEFN